MSGVLNNEGKKISTSWYAIGTEKLKCPVPGCSHSGDVITKVHCRLEHGMERDEVGKKYGYPERVILGTIYDGDWRTKLERRNQRKRGVKLSEY